MRHLPTLLAASAALAALSAAPSALAWGGSSEGGGSGQGDKGKAECCAQDMDCCEQGSMDCCEAGGDHKDGKGGHGHDHGDKGHDHGDGHRGMSGDGMRSHQGYMGDRRMHGGMMGTKTMELRYMPATTGNQHIVLAWDRERAKGQFFSMGFQGNYALQLAPAAGQGNWFSPYWGFLPRVGTQVGNFSADAGALLGVGGMFRTSAGDNLQFRPMWVVEPRVELGWTHDRWRMGLVGTYVLSPNPTEFSGPSVGFRLGFGGRGMRDHHED
jgi:hypothetical protein